MYQMLHSYIIFFLIVHLFQNEIYSIYGFTCSSSKSISISNSRTQYHDRLCRISSVDYIHENEAVASTSTSTAHISRNSISQFYSNSVDSNKNVRLPRESKYSPIKKKMRTNANTNSYNSSNTISTNDTSGVYSSSSSVSSPSSSISGSNSSKRSKNRMSFDHSMNQRFSSLLQLSRDNNNIEKVDKIIDKLIEINKILKKTCSNRSIIREYNLLIKNLGDSGHLDHCLKVLHIMKENNHKPTIVTYTTLISRAASWQKIQIAEKFYNDMLLDNIVPDTQIYNTLINVYAKAKDTNKAMTILTNMENSYNIKPTVITFNTLIDSCARSGNATMAVMLLDMMKDRNLKPDEITYSSIIFAYCQAGNVDLALRFLDNYASAGLTPSTVTYAALLHGMGKAGNLDLAFQFLKSINIKPNVVVISSLIHACGIHGQLDMAFTLYDSMLNNTRSHMQPNSITCSALIDASLKAGYVDKAFKVLTDMKRLNIKLTEVTYTSLISELSRLKQLDRLLEVISDSSLVSLSTADAYDDIRYSKDDIDDDDMTSSKSSLTSDGDTSSSSGSQLMLLNDNAIFPRSAKTIIHKATIGDSCSVIDSVRTNTISGNTSTNDITNTVATSDAYSAAIERYEVLKRTGAKPAINIYRDIIKAYPDGNSLNQCIDTIKNKQMKHDELFRLYLIFQEMKSCNIPIDTAVYNTLVNSCASAGDIERAFETVEAMQSEGIYPDVITYTSLIKACGIRGGKGAVSLAEEVFDAMQQRTNHFTTYIEPTEFTFQCLIQTHLQSNVNNDNTPVNTKRIWELMDILSSIGLTPRLVTYRSCIRAAYIDGDVDKALDVVSVIRQQKKKFDEVIWAIAASICRDKGRYGDEKKLRDDIHSEKIGRYKY